jgi:hypothetical protein
MSGVSEASKYPNPIKMRNKEISIITWKKAQEPEQRYHCSQHPGSLMYLMSDGLRCQICGGVEIATKGPDC